MCPIHPYHFQLLLAEVACTPRQAFEMVFKEAKTLGHEKDAEQTLDWLSVACTHLASTTDLDKRVTLVSWSSAPLGPQLCPELTNHQNKMIESKLLALVSTVTTSGTMTLVAMGTQLTTGEILAAQKELLEALVANQQTTLNMQRRQLDRKDNKDKKATAKEADKPYKKVEDRYPEGPICEGILYLAGKEKLEDLPPVIVKAANGSKINLATTIRSFQQKACKERGYSMEVASISKNVIPAISATNYQGGDPNDLSLGLLELVLAYGDFENAKKQQQTAESYCRAKFGSTMVDQEVMLKINEVGEICLPITGLQLHMATENYSSLLTAVREEGDELADFYHEEVVTVLWHMEH